jgi:hypothetical protein
MAFGPFIRCPMSMIASERKTASGNHRFTPVRHRLNGIDSPGPHLRRCRGANRDGHLFPQFSDRIPKIRVD